MLNGVTGSALQFRTACTLLRCSLLILCCQGFDSYYQYFMNYINSMVATNYHWEMSNIKIRSPLKNQVLAFAAFTAMQLFVWWCSMFIIIFFLCACVCWVAEHYTVYTQKLQLRSRLAGSAALQGGKILSVSQHWLVNITI